MSIWRPFWQMPTDEAWPDVARETDDVEAFTERVIKSELGKQPPSLPVRPRPVCARCFLEQPCGCDDEPTPREETP